MITVEFIIIRETVMIKTGMVIYCTDWDNIGCIAKF